MEKLDLKGSDREELESRVRSRKVRSEDARRARLILLLSEGEPYTSIQSKLRCNRSYVSRWKGRFLEGGIAGLYARQQGRKRSVLTAAMEARILKWTSRKPTDGSTHWTTRKLGKKLGISHTLVATVWKRANLKIHRIERYMASNDPDFETKAADVIGLYVNPPQHAAVFCVDEKTAIQALDRLDPVLPFSPGRLERHGFEYTGTERFLSTRRSTQSPEKSSARQRLGTRAKSLSPFFCRSWPRSRKAKRSTSFWTISRLTKPSGSSSSWSTTRTSLCTSRPPIPPGSIRWRSGLVRSSAM